MGSEAQAKGVLHPLWVKYAQRTAIAERSVHGTIRGAAGSGRRRSARVLRVERSVGATRGAMTAGSGRLIRATREAG